MAGKNSVRKSLRFNQETVTGVRKIMSEENYASFSEAVRHAVSEFLISRLNKNETIRIILPSKVFENNGRDYNINVALDITPNRKKHVGIYNSLLPPYFNESAEEIIEKSYNKNKKF